MADLSHEFDYLNQWSSLSDTEIHKIISNETINTMQRAVDLLRDEAQSPLIVNSGNFAQLVREMRKLYAEGSRLLGNTILEASDWVDKNQPAKARETYERFLSSCTSKFYRDIAKNQLSKLG